ncbi:34538_t:CDS:2, partial [Racocetra persica]
ERRMTLFIKICISSLKDPHLNTLKKIKQWFIQGDKQKKDSSQWFSAQCQFDLVLSINRFLEIVEYVLTNWPGVDLKNNAKKDDQPKMKLVTFKKGMLPENLELVLGQLKIWARDNSAKSVFKKTFTLSDLTILVQAFQNKPLKIKEKK